MPSRLRVRRGISLGEILVVMVLMLLITKMSLPKIAAIREKNAVRAAKLQLASQISTARAAAIRRSQKSRFQYDGTTQRWIATAGPNGTENVVTGSMKPGTLNVVVSPSDGIEFDPRGMATNLTAQRVYRVSRNNVTDSICVSRVGQVSRYCR
jgi:Tfp pilus assembly protein FimT